MSVTENGDFIQYYRGKYFILRDFTPILQTRLINVSNITHNNTTLSGEKTKNPINNITITDRLLEKRILLYRARRYIKLEEKKYSARTPQ